MLLVLLLWVPLLWVPLLWVGVLLWVLLLQVLLLALSGLPVLEGVLLLLALFGLPISKGALVLLPRAGRSGEKSVCVSGRDVLFKRGRAHDWRAKSARRRAACTCEYVCV